jgi:hypothetical protein
MEQSGFWALATAPARKKKLAAAIAGRRMDIPLDIMGAICGTRLAANVSGGGLEEK